VCAAAPQLPNVLTLAFATYILPWYFSASEMQEMCARKSSPRKSTEQSTQVRTQPRHRVRCLSTCGRGRVSEGAQNQSAGCPMSGQAVRTVRHRGGHIMQDVNVVDRHNALPSWEALRSERQRCGTGERSGASPQSRGTGNVPSASAPFLGTRRKQMTAAHMPITAKSTTVLNSVAGARNEA
jgi:hypothetical protein